MSWSYSFTGTVADAKKHVETEFPRYQMASPGEAAARDAAKTLINAALYGGNLDDDHKVFINAGGHEQSNYQGEGTPTKRHQVLRVEVQ